MTGSVSIGSIRGIQVRVHYSFLLILPLLAYLFGRMFESAARAAQVPAAEVGGSPMLWGFLVAVALFAAVLVHELAHSFYGQAVGAKIRDITLLMIGGVSTMIEPPKKLRDEAIMALVGPLASLGIGAALWGVYSVMGETTFNVRFAIYYLAQLNLALGVFNLLPAFPMDGGRILRALLAGRIGMVRGTQVAASLGKGFAALLAVFGVLSFNIVLLFIAYFIFAGAAGEARQVGMRAAIGHLPVREMMKGLTSFVDADDSIAVAAERMVAERRLGLPVMSAHEAIGVVTLEQVAKVPAERRDELRVRDITTPVKALGPEDEVWDALRTLEASGLPQLPVVENGELVGTLRLADVMRGLRLRELAEQPKRPTWRWPGRREAEV